MSSRVALLVVLGIGCSSGGDSGSDRGDADADVDGDADADSGGPIPNGTCDDVACGGDPVGDWELVTFCGPDYVTSVAQRLHFGADHVYSYTSAYGGTYEGTWETAGDTMTITVGDDSSLADYCVGGGLFWWSSNGLSIVREIDVAGSDGGGR